MLLDVYLKMQPKKQLERITAHKVTFEDEGLSSPTTRILQNSKGAQAIYACCGTIAFLFFACKGLLLIFSDEERASFIEFFGGQFASIHYVVQLLLVHHLIMYTVTYPGGKYFRHNKSKLLFAALLSILLCKLAVYYLVYLKEDRSVTIGIACGLENVRMMMKTIAFLIEVNKSPCYTVTLGNFTYFLFAPTLLYRPSYPRTGKPINWTAFASFFTEFLVWTMLLGYFVKDLLRPAVLEHAEVLQNASTTTNELIASYIKTFLIHIANATIGQFYIAFALIDSWANSAAELLCFADRRFYKEWWDSDNPSVFLRKWNRIVGDWLHVYIYQWIISHGVSRMVSMSCIFLLSALYHDYVLLIATGHFTPGFTSVMTISMIATAVPSNKLTFIRYNMLASTFGILLSALSSYNNSQTVFY